MAEASAKARVSTEGYGIYPHDNGHSESGAHLEVYYYNDGNRYEGDLLRDDDAGVGVLDFPDGGRYEGGAWQHGANNGAGILFFGKNNDGLQRGEGTFFNGNYVSGVKWWPDNSRIEGDNDVGTVTWISGNGACDRFEGNYQYDDNRIGVYYFADGRVWMGHFNKNYDLNGYGVKLDAKRNIAEQGYYQADKLVPPPKALIPSCIH